MKSVSEKTYHDLLWTGLIVKALIGLGEIAVGCALIFLNYETIALVLGKFAGSPLGEALIQSFRDFSATPRSVWAFIFLSHGIVKLFFIGELWRNKVWAYPASAVIFILFFSINSTRSHSFLRLRYGLSPYLMPSSWRLSFTNIEHCRKPVA